MISKIVSDEKIARPLYAFLLVTESCAPHEALVHESKPYIIYIRKLRNIGTC